MAPYISLPVDNLDREGFWGKPSATIDWCEENYAVTPFIAEFWNTISGLMMIIPPLAALLLILRSREYPVVHKWSFAAFFIVGIGTWMFHMTLDYSMQLLDELPMIWGATVHAYVLWQVDARPKRHNYRLSLGLVLYCAAVTLVYLVWQEAIFHEVAFGIIITLIIYLNIRTNRLCPEATFLSIYANAAFFLGLLIWIVDNNFCHVIRPLRSRLPWLLVPLLQGHCLWHVLSGLGSYIAVVYGIQARRLYLKKPVKIAYAYLVFPYPVC